MFTVYYILLITELLDEKTFWTSSDAKSSGNAESFVNDPNPKNVFLYSNEAVKLAQWSGIKL
jgi:hypothetical protein